MSFFRVSEPNILDVNLYDLGITILAGSSNIVLSDQFGVQDLVRSADLESAIIAGNLTVQIDYGTGFTTIAAVDYTNRDALAAFLNVYEITNENNNEDLVDGSEVNASGPGSTPLHIHDLRYYTKTALNATTGAGLIGASDSAWTPTMVFSTIQGFINALYTFVTTALDLDKVYTNDADGIMNVNGSTKPLLLRSNGVNDIAVQRKIGADIQDFERASISGNETLLGSPAVGALPAINVRVRTNLQVDGNVTFVGTITDTTVSTLEITDKDITLSKGATSGSDSKIKVQRTVAGTTDSDLLWSETPARWKAGIVGSEETIALLEHDETVSGTWLFNPSPSTDPNQLWTERAAPTTALGSSGQTPMAMFANGVLGVYDKSNSRNKWLSVARTQLVFTGRSSDNNKNEYAYIGLVNSFETGLRLERAKTLIGISAQTQLTETWTVRVRKNGVLTNLASLAITAAAGGSTTALNLDLAAGDVIQVYIDGSSVSSPVIKLEFADTLT